MTTSEKILERAKFYGITCAEFLDDIRFLFEEQKNREGVRKNQVLEILEREANGITTAEIAKELQLKKTNIASVIMELRKSGIKILNINGAMILDKYVNIG